MGMQRRSLTPSELRWTLWLAALGTAANVLSLIEKILALAASLAEWAR
jgi:hypothetical protein